jgi:WD40 repeat protein
VNQTEQASVAINTKAVYGVQVDPFHPQRLASYAEDGVIRIWDMRRPTDPVLTIQASDRSNGLNDLQYSPRRGGLLATHARDSSYIQLWDLQEGTTHIYKSTTIRLDHPTSTSQAGLAASTMDVDGVGVSGTVGAHTRDSQTGTTQRVFGFGQPSTHGASVESRVDTASGAGVSTHTSTGGFANLFGVSTMLDRHSGTEQSSFTGPMDVPVLWRSRQSKCVWGMD